MKDSKQMELITSTSSQEDTLANLSPLQVTKKVSKIRDIFGQSILDLSKSVDRLGSLEKTLVDTLNSVLTPYSRTWRVKVTPQGRLVFQLLASVPTTKEKESGLWPTPTTDSANNRTKKYAQGGTPLTMAIQTWPTPTSRDWKDQIGAYPPSTNVTRGETLMNTVTRRSWPTPTVNDSKSNGSPSQHKRNSKPLNAKVGGTLNPTWVEWLMGYPTGWTDLSPSETASSLTSPTTSDNQSSNQKESNE